MKRKLVPIKERQRRVSAGQKLAWKRRKKEAELAKLGYGPASVIGLKRLEQAKGDMKS